MKVALYGRRFDPGFSQHIDEMFRKFREEGVSYEINKDFLSFLEQRGKIDNQPDGVFDPDSFPAKDTDFIFSIGGDGTFLEAVSYALKDSIPVVGINSGRLGFLANISGPDISQAMDALFRNRISLEERTLLEWHVSGTHGPGRKFALNECTIQKKASSMITIQTYVNGELLNAYWADGLIISTPTGSTAYSMSAGGPILEPGCQNFIISPIAPHNLTVRPVVIRDDAELLLRVTGRDTHYLLSADYHSIEAPMDAEISLRKADYTIRTVRFNHQDFYSTLRSKLMWGADSRN